VNALFEQYDAIASPTRPSVAFPADVEFQKAWPGIQGGPPLIPAGNLCGLPAICLPTGIGEEGLPTSIAFMGAAFEEATLIQLGHDIQAKTKWHRALPKGVGA
jgi:Asp-tRNA(Asn)/Glu-tRNA(Gln) amidotransferase A subunit family amidase